MVTDGCVVLGHEVDGVVPVAIDLAVKAADVRDFVQWDTHGHLGGRRQGREKERKGLGGGRGQYETIRHIATPEPLRREI